MCPAAGFEGKIGLQAPAAGRSDAVRVWMLGGFRVSVGSSTIDQGAWRLKKAASLVKLLALAPGHRLHREQAMDLLWPESGRKAASNNLRQTLHAARRVLDSDAGSRYLASEDESLVLCPKTELWVDVEAFEETSAAARRAKEPAAYRAAIDLYAGELLPEDRYEEWGESRREGLRRLYLSLLVELAGIHEQRGEFGSSIEALRKAVDEEPTNQEAHTGLMRLYAQLGRQAEALGQYEGLKASLTRELATEPNASIRALREEISARRFPPPEPPIDQPPGESPDSPRHNLPTPRTSFIGRESEMLEVKRDLAMTRLLTLTGTGGSGKTRLALEVARGLVGAYPDGVWLVELAPLSEGELVPQAVAQALRVNERPGELLTDTLAEVLRTKRALVVLDNSEHLVEAVARLADVLLDSCPHLRILATSREGLGIAGEAQRLVSPLSVPGPRQQPTAEELERYDSARLFVERARYRNPACAVTPQNAQAVAEICQRLDGIPLAIELAAARVGLSLEQVASRLDDSLRLLTAGSRTASPRQRTLRGALDWSYDLLSESERALFGRLSVFAGGWTLEAVEGAGAGGGIEKQEVLDLLLRLVDKSLVVTETTGDGRLRYGLLEPVRQYAREKLEGSGVAELARSQHASFFLSLAEEAEPRLRGPEQAAWFERLEIEYDNLRAALSWDLERGEAVLALRFGAALGEFWQMRGHLSEGRRWLEAALAKGDAPSIARVRALAKACWIAWEQTDLERATALGEEGLMLARELGDEEGAAATLMNLGVAMMARGELERATALLEEGLPLFRELGDKWGLVRSFLCLGLVAMLRGDYQRAKALMEEGLTVSQESGDVYGSGLALNQLALMSLLQEDYGRAEALCKEALEMSRQSRLAHHIAFALLTLAALASSRGQLVRSARLWGAAEALREAIGTAFSPMELRTYEPYIAAARAKVENAAWEAGWQEGRAMSMEEAIEYALSKGEEPAQTTAPAQKRSSISAQTTSLTLREEEVATLVARGLTNRQIATELSISEHTVANHVARILRKLGLGSRSQLTAWVSERRTPL